MRIMKKYLVFIVAFAAVTVTGCKDFLVEEPPLSQSNELTLSTYEGLDQATAGAYAPLAAAAWYGGDFILLNEMKTSNGKKYIGSDFDTGRLIDWYNMNYTEENTSALWGYAYYVISATNNVIANLTPDKGDEQDLNNLKAECLFLRAFSHFDLVRTYAQPYCYTGDASHPGVPVVITVQASTDKPARATVAKVYEQIVADLLEAESIIDPSYVRAGVKDQRSAVTLEAIQALLSRVYLYMENWQGAADYATKVIDSKKFTMWTPEDLQDAACYRLDVQTEGEVIFEVYSNSGEAYGGGNEAICSLTSKNKYGDGGACADLMNLYEDGDVRATLFHSEESKSNNETVWWTAKYLGKGISSPDYSNTIILRLSEMYLNRAEAMIHGAEIDGASPVSDLQTIASNRNAAPVQASLSWSNGIYLERQKELAWEVHTWFDLGRTKTAMSRTDFVGNENARTCAWPSNLWAMPIPAREHTANGNLEHNPGY